MFIYVYIPGCNFAYFKANTMAKLRTTSDYIIHTSICLYVSMYQYMNVRAYVCISICMYEYV